MTSQDWLSVTWFSEAEARMAGADTNGLRPPLFRRLDRFRDGMGAAVRLLLNGLNSPGHTSEFHDLGLAADITVDCGVGPHSWRLPFYVALASGFRGVGVYWNGVAYSFHLDCRPNFGTWLAVNCAGDRWSYTSVFVDVHGAGV